MVKGKVAVQLFVNSPGLLRSKVSCVQFIWDLIDGLAFVVKSNTYSIFIIVICVSRSVSLIVAEEELLVGFKVSELLLVHELSIVVLGYLHLKGGHKHLQVVDILFETLFASQILLYNLV